MPTKLKRLDTKEYPLFYMRKRGANYVLEKVDHSLFVRPDDLELVEADIDIVMKEEKKEKKEKKAKSRDTDPKPRKSRVPGEWTVRICFEEALTSAQKKESAIELSKALLQKKAHTFFKDLIVSAMEIARDTDPTLRNHLNKLVNSKSCFHFHKRNEGKKHMLYSIIPAKTLPSFYVNKEMIENFVHNIALVEIGHIVKIKKVTAKLA